VVDKIRKTRLPWFSHVSQMLSSTAMYCYIKEREEDHQRNG